MEGHCYSPVLPSSGFRYFGSGTSVEVQGRRKSVGNLQSVVSDCGVTPFFTKLYILVLHAGRCWERYKASARVGYK